MPTQTAIPSSPTRITLSELDRQARIELLNRRLADAADLYSQSKQAHWNVRGPELFQLPELFDRWRRRCFPFIDLIAEWKSRGKRGQSMFSGLNSQNPSSGPRAGVEAPPARARTIVGQWRRCALVLLLPVCGIGDIQTTTQTMSADVSPNGKLSLPASIDLQSPDTRFGSLAGNLTLSYWARTSDSGGGSVTVQATSEFSPAGGPSVSAVSFTCSGATLGAGCSGSQFLATTTQTSLVSLPGGACTGGGGVCSAQEPNTVLLTFAVLSRPGYKTGTYSAQMTVTISTM